MTSLCESVPKLCAERCPELTPNAEFICQGRLCQSWPDHFFSIMGVAVN